MNGTTLSWPLDDVVKFNGTVQHPIHSNGVCLVLHIFTFIVGVPLNLFVAFFLVRLRRLRRKPRNIFSLGLILSNFSAFVPVVVEFTYLHFPEEDICRVYVTFVGLPYVLFMANALMSLVDRYAAIAHPLWHKRWVTVPFAIWSLLIGSLLVAILYKYLLFYYSSIGYSSYY